MTELAAAVQAAVDAMLQQIREDKLVGISLEGDAVAWWKGLKKAKGGGCVGPYLDLGQLSKSCSFFSFSPRKNVCVTGRARAFEEGSSGCGAARNLEILRDWMISDRSNVQKEAKSGDVITLTLRRIIYRESRSENCRQGSDRQGDMNLNITSWKGILVLGRDNWERGQQFPRSTKLGSAVRALGVIFSGTQEEHWCLVRSGHGWQEATHQACFALTQDRPPILSVDDQLRSVNASSLVIEQLMARSDMDMKMDKTCYHSHCAFGGVEIGTKGAVGLWQPLDVVGFDKTNIECVWLCSQPTWVCLVFCYAPKGVFGLTDSPT
ncbi:hypothetical protein Tco_0794382 [Tanacetum coccineum]